MQDHRPMTDLLYGDDIWESDPRGWHDGFDSHQSPNDPEMDWGEAMIVLSDPVATLIVDGAVEKTDVVDTDDYYWLPNFLEPYYYTEVAEPDQKFYILKD